MSRKRVIIGQSEWAIHEDDLESVLGQIKTAMVDGKVVVLELLNAAGRPVTVYLNGSATASVVVDLDTDPKPSEISG